MKNIPVSALIGLFFTALYFLGAIFAPLLAPYGMAEVVADVWEPPAPTTGWAPTISAATSRAA